MCPGATVHRGHVQGVRRHQVGAINFLCNFPVKGEISGGVKGPRPSPRTVKFLVWAPSLPLLLGASAPSSGQGAILSCAGIQEEEGRTPQLTRPPPPGLASGLRRHSNTLSPPPFPWVWSGWYRHTHATERPPQDVQACMIRLLIVHPKAVWACLLVSCGLLSSP